MIIIDHIRLKNMNDNNSYIKNLPVVNNLSKIEKLDLSSDVVFFVGENGTGKSTFLEALAVSCGFNPEGGTKNFNFHTENTHSELHNYLVVSRKKSYKDGFFLRAESFYNVASNIDTLDRDMGGAKIIDSYGGVSLHKQSHGESFLSLMMNRFSGNSLYILDEPEAALSPSKQMAVITRIKELVAMGSQFIIATHSPILMAYPGAKIYQLKEDRIESVSYRETDHYIITREFMNNTDKMLKILLE